MALIIQFTYLQLLDVLTTLAFLAHGAREANPLVRFLMRVGPTPAVSLIFLKTLAVLLAIYCVRRAHFRLLSRVNILFAGLVAWNLLVLILNAPLFRTPV